MTGWVLIALGNAVAWAAVFIPGDQFFSMSLPAIAIFVSGFLFLLHDQWGIL